MTNKAHSKPPEGVIAGESVPVESEEDNYTEQAIEETMNVLKTHGKPYTEMQDSELREKALERLRATGVKI